MSWASFDAGWCAPELRTQEPDQTVGLHPNSTQSHFQPSFFPIHEQDIQPIDQLLFNCSVKPASVPPLSGYTIPPGTLQANLGTPDEIYSDISPRSYQYSDRTTQNDDHRPIVEHLAMHTNANPSSHPYQMAIPKNNVPSHKNVKTCIRCEWKGCTYTGVFTKKALLRRHIETQHVAPGAYSCPVFGCKKLFNRKDNQEEHLRRVHRTYL